ncbi:MAG TPA: hypothetical protein VLF19_06185 [Methylomirabilota bacterium]|nr:hypothetical protein [Methylomirabilota bacterium]
MIRFAALVFVLALLAAPIAMAQPSTPSLDQSGIVERIDQTGGVVVLEGGRMYRITPSTVVSVNGQPVAFGSLRPGQTVIVRSAEPVMLQNGQYVVVTPGAGTTVTTAPGAVTAAPATTVTPSGGGTVTTSPGSTVVVTAPPAAAARQTIYGQVSDVDPTEIQIRTDKGKFEVRLPEAMRGQIKEGDNVQIDLTFTPTNPAASPRMR